MFQAQLYDRESIDFPVYSNLIANMIDYSEEDDVVYKVYTDKADLLKKAGSEAILIDFDKTNKITSNRKSIDISDLISANNTADMATELRRITKELESTDYRECRAEWRDNYNNSAISIDISNSKDLQKNRLETALDALDKNISKAVERTNKALELNTKVKKFNQDK